jgi:hypothetical protein
MSLVGRIAAGTDWSWAQTAVLIAAIIAILGATVTATLTHLLNQRTARRERQVRAFAEALAAVEEYAELPYRIRRRRPTAAARHELTEQISRLQSRLAFHQGWLRIEAPCVAASYEQLVRAARRQAGGQMRDAWTHPPAIGDAGMSLGTAYPRTEIDRARNRCVAEMRRDLGPGFGGHAEPAPPGIAPPAGEPAP